MTTTNKKVDMVTCLGFDKNAEEAVNFYSKTFPNSRVTKVLRAPIDYPAGKAGDVLTVEFTLLGQPFVALNGGHDGDGQDRHRQNRSRQTRLGDQRQSKAT